MKNNQGERIVIGIKRKVFEYKSRAMMYKKSKPYKECGEIAFQSKGTGSKSFAF